MFRTKSACLCAVLVLASLAALPAFGQGYVKFARVGTNEDGLGMVKVGDGGILATGYVTGSVSAGW